MPAARHGDTPPVPAWFWNSRHRAPSLDCPNHASSCQGLRSSLASWSQQHARGFVARAPTRQTASPTSCHLFGSMASRNHLTPKGCTGWLSGALFPCTSRIRNPACLPSSPDWRLQSCDVPHHPLARHPLHLTLLVCPPSSDLPVRSSANLATPRRIFQWANARRYLRR